MSYKSSLIYAWIIYVGIILLIFSSDYYIRASGVDFYYSGLNEIIWMIALIFDVCASGYFIIYSFRHIKNNYYKFLHLIVNAFLGFVFYVISSYLYVVGLGIDSV